MSLAAYAFARLKFKGKNLVFTLFLSLMMIPNELVVITNFTTITDWNLRNSFLGLILPSVTSVFYIYLLKENFEQVPDELYRAAKVDGTSDLKFLWKVMLPICRPTLVTVIILKIIECWNSYVWPRLITDDPAYFLVSNGIQEIRENGFGRENIPAMMAAVVVISIPLILLFLIFRRRIMEGRLKRRSERMSKHLIRKSRTALLFFAVVFLLSLALSGCHGSRGNRRFFSPRGNLTPKQIMRSPSGQKTIPINGRPISTSRPSRTFRRCTPNITVNLRLYTDYGKIYNDVITNISTGTTPNVCITYPDHIATYLTGDQVVVPLNELFSDQQYGLGGTRASFRRTRERGDHPRNFWKNAPLTEPITPSPYMRSTEACYINKNLS